MVTKIIRIIRKNIIGAIALFVVCHIATKTHAQETTVGFEQEVYFALDRLDTAPVRLIRRGDLSGSSSVTLEVKRYDGEPVKFEETTDTYLFSRGQDSLWAHVPLIESEDDSPDTALLQLSNPSSGTLLSENDSALLKISRQVRFEFAENPFMAMENDGEAIISILRSGNTNVTSYVEFSAESFVGTAKKFIPKTATFEMAPGEREIMARITLIDDDTVPRALKIYPEQVSLEINFTNSPPDTLNPGPVTSQLEIYEDDQGVALIGTSDVGVITGIQSPEGQRYFFDVKWIESDAEFQLPVYRVGPMDESLLIDYQVEPVSATPGTDFILADGSLIFEPGQEMAQIPVTLRDNDIRDGNRMFLVRISTDNPDVIVTIPEAEVTIKDDDIIGAPGTLARGFPSEALPCPDFNVQALKVQPDGRLLVVSLFRCEDMGYLFRINQNGNLDSTFNGVFSDRIGDLWLDGSGRIYINSQSAFSQDFPDPYFLRLNPDGSIDTSWQTTFDGKIHDLDFLEDGRIVVIGDFENVNGRPREAIALLNRDGELDESFSPLAGLNAGTASRVAQLNTDRIIVTKISVSLVDDYFYGLLAMDINGNVDFGFDSSVTGNELIKSPDGSVMISDGSSYGSIQRMLPDGALDPAFHHFEREPEILMGLPDGRLLASYGISPPEGFNSLVRLFADGTLDSAFIGDIDREALAADYKPEVNDLIAIGGSFKKVNGIDSPYLAQLYNNESTATPQIQWNASRQGVPESGTVSLTLIRDGDLSLAFDVEVVVASEGTAMPDEDFEFSRHTVSFQAGESYKNVPVNIIPDDSLEGEETFCLEIDSASIPAEIELANNDRLEVTILDDEVSIYIVPEVTADEAAGSILVDLTREGGQAYPVPLELEQISGDAEFGIDYRINNTHFVIPAGERGDSISLHILDNPDADGTRTAVFKLSPVNETTSIAGTGEFQLFIQDNDVPGFAGDGFNRTVSKIGSLGEGVNYAFGNFTSVQGQMIDSFALLDSFGRLISSFNYPGSSSFNALHGVIPLGGGEMLISASYSLRQNMMVVLDLNGNEIDVGDAFQPIAFGELDQFFDEQLLATDPDGNIVAVQSKLVGLFDPDSILLRYTHEGALDENFTVSLFEGKRDFAGQRVLLSVKNDGSICIGNIETAYPPDQSEIPIPGLLAFYESNGNLNLEKTEQFSQDVNVGSIVDMTVGSEGFLYLGGTFEFEEGVTNSAVVRVLDNGVVDETFTFDLTTYLGTPAPADIPDFIRLASDPTGGLYVGFVTSEGNSNLLKLLPDGAIDSRFGPHHANIDTEYDLLASEDGTLFIAGDFDTVDGQTRYRFARLYPDGSLGTVGPMEITDFNISGPDAISLKIDSRLEGPAKIESSVDLNEWGAAKDFELRKGLQEIQISPVANSDSFRAFKIRYE